MNKFVYYDKIDRLIHGWVDDVVPLLFMYEPFYVSSHFTSFVYYNYASYTYSTKRR